MTGTLWVHGVLGVLGVLGEKGSKGNPRLRHLQPVRERQSMDGQLEWALHLAFCEGQWLRIGDLLASGGFPLFLVTGFPTRQDCHHLLEHLV